MNPAADRVFNFEYSFMDTVVVMVDQKVVAKKYLARHSSGLADQRKITATSGAKITSQTTPNDCVEFKQKDGYKYLFINRDPTRHWDIAYATFSRGYF